MTECKQRVNLIIDYPRKDVQNDLHLPGHVGQVARNIFERTEDPR